MNSNSKRLLKYVTKQKAKILYGVLATLLMSLVELATGGLLKFLINQFDKFEGSFTQQGAELMKLPLRFNFKIPILQYKVKLIDTTLSGSEGIFKGLLWLCLIFVTLYFLQAVFNYLRRVFMNAATQRILQNFKTDIYNKILKLPYSFFSKSKTGDVVSRVTYDVSTLNEIIDLFIEVARASIYILVFIPVMLYMSWQLSLFAIIFFPLSVILIEFITRKIKIVSKSITDNVGSYTAFLEERINRFKLVKNYGKEADEGRVFENLVDDNYRYNIKLIKLRFSMNPSNDFLGMMLIAGVYLFASYKITHGSATVADMVMFLYLVRIAFKPIKKVAEAWGRLHVALVSTHKIFRLLDEQEEVFCNPSNKEMKPIESLSFNSIVFSYSLESDALFQNVNLHVKGKDVILLSGKTGVGKSTLLKLLPAFLIPTKGEIAVNEVSYSELNLADIRKVIKLVDSNDHYFDGTILENIMYGNQNLTNVQKKEFVEFLGLQSTELLNQQIGKNGIALSMGQQQKLAVLRALVAKPQILILDEVFTSLDDKDIHYIFDACKTIPFLFVVSRKNEVKKYATRHFVLQDKSLQEIES
ncbi:MAG: ABC transporter ATP-binding protein [Salinivirgaceae bacterium]|jgi:subfamily B ATP-binding cassette protein MsbA|nr:ABC transporter ATP-binding protein [Salinivirgaceae bacterium]